jgi:serine/threonine protein kinase
MSPEQARGETVDIRTDLFSFGAVLYEMITGRQAFSGNTAAVIFHAILDKNPASISRFNRGASCALDRLIRKALKKDRDVRYQSAAEMRSDLERMKRDINSRGISAPLAELQRQPRARKGVESLAVLPFVNTVGNTDTEYLCEGIAESLINNLSQLPKIRVVQRTTSFRYKGPKVIPQQVGRELNVVSAGFFIRRASQTQSRRGRVVKPLYCGLP